MVYVNTKWDNVENFFGYINERHFIYLKRQDNEKPPWTEDKIIQTYSFCNVYRELDKVTIWIRENWKEPYKDHPHIPFAMSVARQINHPPTLKAIGFPESWDPTRVKAIMQDRMDNKKKVYTGAYMLTGTLGGTKVEQTIDKILTPLFNNPPKLYEDSLEKTWKEYLPYAGFSGFMAYEVVTDLRFTKHLENAKDIMTWANAGPGAKRGLNRIHNRKLEQTIKKDQLTAEMKELLDVSDDYLDLALPRLEMREIEHCLCEFDKYERVRLGEGRPRSKYKYG
jgi:hypothetical protein|tara:strand:- start:10370 stop:11212 length:843 start_codon:yes stop_codon:yes gene_type:complete